MCRKEKMCDVEMSLRLLYAQGNQLKIIEDTETMIKSSKLQHY